MLSRSFDQFSHLHHSPPTVLPTFPYPLRICAPGFKRYCPPDKIWSLSAICCSWHPAHHLGLAVGQHSMPMWTSIFYLTWTVCWTKFIQPSKAPTPFVPTSQLPQNVIIHSTLNIWHLHILIVVQLINGCHSVYVCICICHMTLGPIGSEARSCSPLNSQGPEQKPLSGWVLAPPPGHATSGSPLISTRSFSFVLVTLHTEQCAMISHLLVQGLVVSA